jgi:hypothetical protein
MDPHASGFGVVERIVDAPDQFIGLSASGTAMERDVVQAMALLTGARGSKAAGLAVGVDHDFDGCFAELARVLTSAGEAKSLLKIAVVTEADRMEEARPSGFDRAGAPVRLFSMADRRAAFDWASAT